MERVILHSDMNNFYAGVECFLHPELRGRAVAVTGDAEKRHGVVLAKSMEARRMGVKTGEPIWQAVRKCPGLVTVQADFYQYHRFSRMASALYREYTGRVEPFGLDEAWLDVSHLCQGPADGKRIADEIRSRITGELGLTASIGVSFNKVFAKLGSDLQKPDATTELSRSNFREKVWTLPAEALLYVGKKTKHRLNLYGIRTIGDIARADPQMLYTALGKPGLTLHEFANGRDASPVRRWGEREMAKSIGNSTTMPRDLAVWEDVKLMLWILSESVAERIRRVGLKCAGVQLYIRDGNLNMLERQMALKQPTDLSRDIAAAAMALFQRHYRWEAPVRSLGVAGTRLVDPANSQANFLEDSSRQGELERAVDDIRRRFGQKAIVRARVMTDAQLAGMNPMDDHKICPLSFFGNGGMEL